MPSDGTGKKIITLILHRRFEALDLWQKRERDRFLGPISADICMEFGIEKCAVLVMKRGWKIHNPGIRLPEGKLILLVDQTEGTST